MIIKDTSLVILEKEDSAMASYRGSIRLFTVGEIFDKWRITKIVPSPYLPGVVNLWLTAA